MKASRSTMKKKPVWIVTYEDFIRKTGEPITVRLQFPSKALAQLTIAELRTMHKKVTLHKEYK